MVVVTATLFTWSCMGDLEVPSDHNIKIFQFAENVGDSTMALLGDLDAGEINIVKSYYTERTTANFAFSTQGENVKAYLDDSLLVENIITANFENLNADSLYYKHTLRTIAEDGNFREYTIWISYLPVVRHDQFKQDLADIDAYIADNIADSVIKHWSGIRYVLHHQGNGISPLRSDFITANYHGYLLDSTTFDSGTLTNQKLLDLIPGWQVMFPLLNSSFIEDVDNPGQDTGTADQVTMFLPSDLGYGDNETASISANSVLVFDARLVRVQ